MRAADTALPGHELLKPPAPDGLGTGAALALLVHVGLIAALAFAVRWHASEPEGLSAELWSAVPQSAAPPAVAPPPPPPAPPPAPTLRVAPPPPPPAPAREVQREAQIAIEKARAKERLEQQRREAEREQQQQKKERERLQREEAQKQERAEKARREKAEREKAEKAEKAAKAEKAQADKQAAERRKQEDAARAAKLRSEQMARLNGLVGANGGPTSTGNALRDSGPSVGYAGRIRARVKPNIVFTDQVDGNPAAEVEVRAGPDGTILGSRLLKSSGSREWDEAVLRAIERTGMLPRDTDGRVPSPMTLVFKPRD